MMFIELVRSCRCCGAIKKEAEMMHDPEFGYLCGQECFIEMEVNEKRSRVRRQTVEVKAMKDTRSQRAKAGNPVKRKEKKR